jgi:hypothetical protein
MGLLTLSLLSAICFCCFKVEGPNWIQGTGLYTLVYIMDTSYNFARYTQTYLHSYNVRMSKGDFLYLRAAFPTSISEAEIHIRKAC